MSADTSRLSAVIARSARNVSACGRRSTLARTASTEGTSMCRPGPSVRWYLPSRSTRSTCSLGTIRRHRSRMNTINATTTAAVNASALNDEGSMSTMVLPVRVPVEPALAVLETRAQVERHRPIAGVDGHVLQSPVTRLCQNGVEQRRADPAVAQLGYHVHRLHVAGAPVDPRRARYPGSQHQPRHPGHSTVHLGQERQMGRQVVDDPGGEVLQECRVIRAGLVALLARPPPPQPRQGRGIGAAVALRTVTCIPASSLSSADQASWSSSLAARPACREDTVRIAAAQARPVWLDPKATTNKVRTELEQAGVPEYCRGGSAVAAPDGSWLVEPVADQERLVVVDIDASAVRESRHNFDPSGHGPRESSTSQRTCCCATATAVSPSRTSPAARTSARAPCTCTGGPARSCFPRFSSGRCARRSARCCRPCGRTLRASCRTAWRAPTSWPSWTVRCCAGSFSATPSYSASSPDPTVPAKTATS